MIQKIENRRGRDAFEPQSGHFRRTGKMIEGCRFSMNTEVSFLYLGIHVSLKSAATLCQVKILSSEWKISFYESQFFR